MLNSHQILAGARTKGGIKTYVGAEYGTALTVTLAGTTFSFTGNVEFDGETFNLASYPFNAASLSSLLVDGSYTVSAVPAYTEPADRAAAETAGLNYYVDKSPVGESLLHYFLPSAIEASVATAGGYDNLYKLVAMGAANATQIQLVNSYSDALEKLSDPRYVGKLLDPTGVAYVLTRTYTQDNSSKVDALVGMNNNQIELFKATQGYIAAERKVFPKANAYITGNNGGVLAKISRAFAYASLNDANADLNGIEIKLDYKEGDTLSAPVDLDDVAIPGASYTHVAVFEYYQPTYMSRGHEGTNPGVYDLYTKEDASILGRINPVYQARDFEVARVSAGRGMPLSAITKYGYPLPLAKFTLAGGVYSAATKYTPGSILPSGGIGPTP
jgi:hypothetical protein